jgi:hypothetical protein
MSDCSLNYIELNAGEGKMASHFKLFTLASNQQGFPSELQGFYIYLRKQNVDVYGHHTVSPNFSEPEIDTVVDSLIKELESIGSEAKKRTKKHT